MKKTLAALFALISLPLIAEETEANVYFWSAFELGDELTMTYVNGSVYTFNKGHFTEEEIPLKDALEDYASTYTALKSDMERAGFKSSQVSYNMGVWAEAMSGEMFRGIAEQQKIDAARIESAKGTTEQAAKDVANVMKDTTANMLALKGSLEGQLSQVADGNSQLISGLASAISENKKDLEDKIKELEEKKNADDETIRNLQSQVEEYSTKIAASEAAIKKLQESMKEGYLSNTEKYVLTSTYTNEIKRVSKWLGYDENENPGIFMKPKMPDGADYGENDNMMNLLDDYGIVGYYSISNQLLGVAPMTYAFVEEEAGTGENKHTNVTATFGAPITWAGDGVICTDGVYRVKEPITWITNITQNIDARTAITNVFNNIDSRTFVTNITMDVDQRTFVTNLTQSIDNRSFVTNIVFNTDKRTFVTNLIDNSVHQEFVTNIVFNTDKRTFITNLIDNSVHQEFVTNLVFNNDNRTFVTNMFDYSTTITNLFRIYGYGKNDDPTPYPTPDPEDDPYSPEYETEEHKDEILPIKNALNIVAITNKMTTIVNLDNAFVRGCLWTNNTEAVVADKIEIRGFTDAGKNTESLGEGYFPTKHLIEGVPYIKWFEFPWELTNMVYVLTNNTEIIKGLEILKKYSSNSIINNNITMATNLFAVVHPDTLLDNASIWTNGERQIEIKGFEKADAYTVPMVVEDSDDNAIEWSKKDFSDSEIVKEIGQYAQYNRSIGIADTNEFIQAYGRRIYEIYGFDDAEENTVPVKCKTIGNNMEIEWKPYGGSALKFKGNYDETEVVVGNGGTTNTVTFAALDDGENPSVKVKVEADGANGVIIKLGAFYK